MRNAILIGYYDFVRWMRRAMLDPTWFKRVYGVDYHRRNALSDAVQKALRDKA